MAATVAASGIAAPALVVVVDVQPDDAVVPAEEVVPVAHAVQPADAASVVAPLLSSGCP